MLAHVGGLSTKAIVEAGKYPLPACRTLEGESGEMCDLMHTSNHHYFDGDNKAPLSDGRHRLGKATHSGGALVSEPTGVQKIIPP
jgi:hypothetical protein